RGLAGSDAGPFFIDDLIGGSKVLATIAAPAVVAEPLSFVTSTGTATIDYQIPLDTPAGPLTDVVSVSWADANGNVYGPLTSTFTTNVQAGSFNGEILLSGDMGLPGILATQLAAGTPRAFTATVINPNGNPVPSVSVHFVITGPNARAVDV